MGWHVFIDINNEIESICYGIVRSYTGISGMDIKEQLFTGISDTINLSNVSIV